jgi:hypothetical protein
MHSPIIYLIKKEKDTNHNGFLPEDYQPSEELLLDLIHESDWLESNILSNRSWHRNNWSQSHENLLNRSPYYQYIDEEDRLELIITKDNVKQWFKQVIESHHNYAEALQKRLNKDELFMFNPFDGDDGFALQNEYDFLVGKEYGGIRFVIYEEHQNELELYDAFSTEKLIEYAKDEMLRHKTNEVTFEICYNISGDYHF